ncbi:hypothetical protein Scep_017668 [Stephania cephalantha]|uniref:TORTIFOLIA1/SINE1-2 N-terminal domain-containing protein n=1 Tax=Stephania cephalantha TaxID=152367 RepID=A0AAP0NVV8_9MAGN
MALPKRSSSSSSSVGGDSSQDLKHRVIASLNKLSDRDTSAIAVSELESIARSLSPDSFPSFLSCIFYTDSSQKPLVRRQCARLLSFLSQTHGDSLSPHLPKMLSNVVKRLRDPDSAVRLACVQAVSAMAKHITRPPFSVFLKLLTEPVAVEQDWNSQIGSAMCLGSAIDAAPDPDPQQLQRLAPRLVKLLRSDSFKAKPALLGLIGSIVGAGGARGRNVVESLVPCVVEFLSCEDWAARKAAAEVLERLAKVEGSELSEFKAACLVTFESRRFDKVKAVRETMNRMLDAWREIPDVSTEVSPPPHSNSSSRAENASDGINPPGGTMSSDTRAFESPQFGKTNGPKRRLSLGSRSSASSVNQRTPLKNSETKSSPALFRKKPANWKIEIAVPHDPTFPTMGKDERGPESMDNESPAYHKSGAKNVFANKNSGDKGQKFGGSKAGSRVFPLQQEESLESNVVVSNNTHDVCKYHKNSEDLSLIRKQLLQIENQQSSLLDLLQKFMGSSQNGMRALETRVQGLEIALDEISYDIAVSTGRISNPESVGHTCCMLPGAEFLSSKFWRKTDGRQSVSRFSSSRGTPSRAALYDLSDRESNIGPTKLESRKFRIHGSGGFIVNPLADNRDELREAHVNRFQNNITHDSESPRCGGVLGVPSSMAVIPPANVTTR